MHMLTTAVVFITLLVENLLKIGESFQKGSGNTLSVIQDGIPKVVCVENIVY